LETTLKKRILIVSEYFYPEEFKINEMALGWKERGYEVDILTLNPTYPHGKIFEDYQNRWYTKDNYKGMTVYRLKSVTGYKESLFKKLLKYFSFMILGSVVSLKIGKRYDYVFGFDIGALTGMLPAVLLKKVYNKKVTLWVQDIWPDSVYAYGFKKSKTLEYFLNGFVKFIYRHTDSFAITGQGFEERILPYIEDKQEIRYIPNWADDLNKELKPFSFSDDKKMHFTFAGNIGKMQNLDNVIMVFGQLSKVYLDRVQLNIIGDGTELDNLQKKVEKNQFKNIIFWGRQPRDEMYQYFQASDFLIVSLLDEPIFSLTVPAKVQTYIASNKPILAVLKGDTVEMLKENKLGYSANPNNLNEIEEMFKKAIDTPPKKLKEFTHNCEELTKNLFNKEKIISDALELLIRKRV